jgi:pimeloyl-ACP methyl ester carboxylesterase
MSSTVVALHYWAGAGREFNPLQAELPGVRLLAPDLPGFGEQEAPAGFDYSVRAYAEWVAAYLQQHAVAAFTLIGHSMGGKIALALAARRPRGLRHVLLLSPSPPTPEPMSDPDRAAAQAAYGNPLEAEKTFRKITQQPLLATQHAEVVADNLRSSRAAWQAWLKQGSREDISAALSTLEVPCSVLVGAHDRAVSAETQHRHTLPWLPVGTPLRVEPKAGHLLPLEAPAAVAALVLAPFH